MTSRTVLIDRHPGRNSQSIGLARAIDTDPDLIQEPSVGVVGTKGDSQCYLGGLSKVDAIPRLGGRAGPYRQGLTAAAMELGIGEGWP